MRAKILATALLCLLAAACSHEPDPPPPVSVNVGSHLVSFQVPAGWEHLDHGSEHRFQRELSLISASDLGPATPEAYRREIHRAHELFRDHRVDDAGDRLSDLDMRPFFPDADRWKKFAESWWKAVDGGHATHVSRYDAEVAWNRVLTDIEWLPTLEFATFVEHRFPSIETAAHREIAARQPMEIDGRAALRIETWDRLSHDQRGSFLFVLNEGNLLMFRMEMGNYDGMKPAFETLARSLAFQSDS